MKKILFTLISYFTTFKIDPQHISYKIAKFSYLDEMATS